MDCWQISETVAFIIKHKATKIALQFPDHLLHESSSISILLENELNKLSNDDDIDYKIYIMADTTFAPCCVDEISALHVNTDVIIHYGYTCCSPTNRIPVFHVLGFKQFNIQLLLKLFFETTIFKTTFNSFKKILILYEPHYYKYKNQFIQLFKHNNIQFIITDINNKSTSLHINKNNNSDNDDIKNNNDKKKHFCGFYYDPFLSSKEWNKLLKRNDFNVSNIKSSYCVLYIGDDSFDEYSEVASSQNQLYLSLLTNFGSCFKFITYNPNKIDSLNMNINDIIDKYDIEYIFSIIKNEQLLSKILMYRYSLIEKVKNSDIIGIVCATLVVNNYLDIIQKLKENISKSFKKSYLLSIGKINQAKLGNFSEIDIFVVITCPMSFQYLLPVNQTSFFKNLVTPYDIMIALNDNNSPSYKWTGMYSTDFNDILNHSYKMGGINPLLLPKNIINNDKNNNNQNIIAKYGKSGGLIKKDATDYMLDKRTWKGVKVVSDDLAPSKIQPGLDGIASQYKGEYKYNV